jgi:hypothetical protein
VQVQTETTQLSQNVSLLLYQAFGYSDQKSDSDKLLKNVKRKQQQQKTQFLTYELHKSMWIRFDPWAVD